MSIWSDYQALIIAAVTVGGGIIGVVGKALFDHWSQQRRLHFERQQKLIDAQSNLLDDLGKVSWKFRFDAIKVAYYSKNPDEEKYAAAVADYQKNCWESLSELRFTATRAGRLFDKSELDRLEAFYQYVNELDTEIEKAIATDDPDARRSMFEKIDEEINNKLRTEISDVVLRLAKRVDLTPRAMKPSEGGFLPTPVGLP